MVEKKKLYEGKAKIIYKSSRPNTLIQYFKDDATAFNNKKKDIIPGKGVINNFISEIVSVINQSGGNFLGGKFSLWVIIIYTGLLIYVRYEDNPIEYTFKIPVVSYPLIFLISGFYFFFGFTFSEMSGFYFFWLIFFVFVFFSLFFTSKVFKNVYLREFPEEYKKDVGDSKP